MIFIPSWKKSSMCQGLWNLYLHSRLCSSRGPSWPSYLRDKLTPCLVLLHSPYHLWTHSITSFLMAWYYCLSLLVPSQEQKLFKGREFSCAAHWWIPLNEKTTRHTLGTLKISATWMDGWLDGWAGRTQNINSRETELSSVSTFKIPHQLGKMWSHLRLSSTEKPSILKLTTA